MARTRSPDRVANLIDAAIRIFSRKGFRRTQMADVAREMNVSQGLLYNYVESKEALFYLVVDQGFGLVSSREPRSLPVRTPAPGTVVRRIAERFRSEASPPKLSEALKHSRAEDPSAELKGIVRELYAIVYRTAPAITMVENSALDMPDIAALFYGKMRAGIIARLTRLIESRIAAGQYRGMAHPAVAARVIIETVNWFARNRRGDPAPQDISDEAAEETVVDFIVGSLIQDRESVERSHRTREKGQTRE